MTTTTRPSDGKIVVPNGADPAITSAASINYHLRGEVTVQWMHHSTGTVGLTLSGNGSGDVTIILPLGTEVAVAGAINSAVLAALAAPKIGTTA